MKKLNKIKFMNCRYSSLLDTSHAMVLSACDVDGDRVSCYVNEILDCYSKLSQSPDLTPSPSISCLFERLVDLCSQIPSDAITRQVRQSNTANDITLPDSKLDSLRP